MNPKFAFFISMIAALFVAGSATAQISDSDGDLVPDAFDNCRDDANGPAQTSNQVDTDTDGYGNACDADYDNDFAVTAGDFGIFLGTFGGTGDLTDHDGDGSITPADFAVFLGQFPGAPGTSGLACAGTVPCTP